MDGETNGASLRLISGGGTSGPEVTGEQVLREGFGMLGDYFMRRLTEIGETDPLRREIEDLAARHRALAAPALPQLSW